MSARFAGGAATAVIRQEQQQQQGFPSFPIQTDSTLAGMMSFEDTRSSTGEAEGDEVNLRSNTLNDLAHLDLGSSVIELDALFQQARDELVQVFDGTVCDVKRVVTQRAIENKRRWIEWKASVSASYEAALSVQSERAEKLHAKIDDMTKLLDDSINDVDSLRADNGRLRREIEYLKATTVHVSHAGLLEEAFAMGQAGQEAETTAKAVVAALPELRMLFG